MGGITSLALFSDSQMALWAVHSLICARPGQLLIKFVKNQIQQLPEDVMIEFYWTLGHEGIDLNEKADMAAKQVARSDGRTHLPKSLLSLLQETWIALSFKSSDFISHKQNLTTPAKKIADALNGLEKGQAAAIFQLHSGHCPLNVYLHHFKKATSKYCSFCGVPETVAHFLLYCRWFRMQQRTFRMKVKAQKLKINLYNVNDLLDDPRIFLDLAQYVLDTSCFEHLCSYLPDEN
ncbi:hypothetical protein CROQUDRAFT_678951 [Cronartium quercuum f. sp. fusiforme G11]|uniref:RNase H type-1 domain-containing protein n=1 Tax=Cronartium quercuum f. sp. fusiforme G11 TaxID=708437 RepID=A0A9P6T976_9BASI|nr:hypothetical protein CROQUDRAFT_678951 [Cronartium quercuum f. sp. fusiforme G11]